MSEEHRIRIIIDSHERGATFVDILEEMHPIEIRALPAGDILVHDLLIERKSISDFFTTLNEDRLFSQLKKLKDASKRQLLLIEGTGMRYHLDSGSLMGLYIRICAGWQIPIIHTRDGEHTAETILRIYRQDAMAPAGPFRPRPRKHRFRLTETSVRVLTMVPGIGPKHAISLATHFKTLSDIFSASPAELQKVPGIGRLKAAAIMAANKPFINPAIK
jgi:ERCC4-type nuclease